MNYILHYCKDKQCNSGWIDEDTMCSAKPPSWRYCPECVSKGRQNPKKKPIDPELAERMQSLREMAKQKAPQPVGINETLSENSGSGV